VDSAALTAIVSGAVAVGVAALTAGSTYLLTRRREREADWRKTKLDCYREYIMALSGIVEGHDTPEAHLHYVHAVNSLMLVASSKVLNSLYEYMDYTRSTEKLRDRHDRLLTDLVRAMRQDVYPPDRTNTDPLQFHLISLPPHLRQPRDPVQES
jgi:hypothetical protein